MSKKRWESLDHYSSWRKISVGMWGQPNDPTIYGFETVDFSRTVEYLDEVTRVSGVKVSPASYCAAMMAEVYRRHPELNVIMINKKVRRRKTADIFCQVAIANENAASADLSGVKITEADKLDLVEIAQILGGKAERVRAGQDAEMEQTKSMVGVVPPWLMRPLLKAVDFLTFNVPVDLDKVGVRSDPFGSCMVTSVGQFDIKQGFAPLVPVSRCPVVVLPGVVHEAPFAIDGEVVARKALTVSCTFDHRVFDGYQIGHFVRLMREILTHPRQFFPEPQTWAVPKATEDAQARRPEDEAPKPAQ